MTETLVSREGKTEAAMEARERDLLATLSGNKKSTVRPARWTFRRALGWGLILAFLVPLFVTLFGMSSANANEEAELEGTSFYELSAELMDVFSAEQDPSNRPTEEEAEEGESSGSGWHEAIRVNPGSAGSFLGYLDVNIVESPSRWALSQLSGSSDAMGYENLVTYESGETAYPDGEQGFQNYAHYGAALNGLGFDDTSTGLSMNLGGVFMGAIMYAAYHIVYLVDIIFWLFMNILQALNPFRLFYLGMYAISPDLADGMTGGHGATQFVLFPGTGIETETNALSGLVNWIGGWYQSLVALSWAALVPIFLSLFIIGLVLFKKMDKGTALKRLLTRLLFIGFGLPLFGSLYSATLDTLTDGLGAGNRGASQVVLSTYVDFEQWSDTNRLAVPDGAVIEWDRESNRPSSNAEACARNTALAINAEAHGLDITGPSVVCGTSGGNDAAGAWSGAVGYSEDSSGLLSGYDESGNDTGSSNSPFSEANDASVVRDLLGRYMGGSQVAAASYETSTKARMVAANNQGTGGINGSSGEEEGRMVGWFEEITSGYDDGASDSELPNNPLLSVSSNNRAGLQAANIGNDTTRFVTNNQTTECNQYQVWDSGASPRACNLAPLAMYNYLNTGFDATSMTVYSSGNVMSEATREIHNSVNATGTGVMSFLYWMNSITLLGAFIVVGLTYALAMLVGGVKRGFQLVAAVPFATLGAIAGIAKVIIYSFALIIEVLVTIFVYLLVQEFLLSLPQIIEAPLASILGNLNSGALPSGIEGLANMFSGGVLAMIVPIFSIIATLAFTIMALKLRKAVIKAADEAVTKMVEKFLDTNATPATAGGGSGLAQGIGSGVGAGAGAAAANRLMTGSKGSKGGSSNVSGTNGPDGVSTGPGNGPSGSGGGNGRGLGAMGAGGTTALLDSGSSDGQDSKGSANGQGPDVEGSDKEAEARGSGDGIDGEGSNDPNDPNRADAMGYASDDQEFGEKVRTTGLSMDGKGYSSEDSKDSSHSEDSKETSDSEASTSEQDRVNGTEVASETTNEHGSANLGGTHSAMSERERLEAEAAARNGAASDSSASNSDSSLQNSDRDSEQSDSSSREVRAGEDTEHESSQQTLSESARDSAQADREVSATQNDRDGEGSAVENNSTTVNPSTGASVENTSNESKLKQTGGEENLSQDNRADQKNFDEQNVEQDNSSEHKVDSKPGTAAAAAGTGAGVGAAATTAAKSTQAAKGPKATKSNAEKATTKGAAAPSEKKTTGTPAKTAVSPARPKTPTRNTQARKGALSGAAKGGAKGAVVGGAKGAVTGVAGGLPGIGAGAARGAAVGGAKGAAIGGATGGVKGATKKPQPKTPKGPKAAGATKASATTNRAASSAPGRPTPQSSAPAVPKAPSAPRAPQAPKASSPKRAQPARGKTAPGSGSNSSAAPRKEAPKPPSSPSAPSPVRPTQTPKRPSSGSTPDQDK